jgi:hypothetical protein
VVAGPKELSRKELPPLEVEAVLDLVLASAARLFQGEGGSIMLRVADDELEVVAAPTNPAALGATVRFGVGVSGRVAATCEPVLIAGRVNERTKAVDSGVCLPLVHRGEIFGVLNINAKPVHSFANHDLDAGTAFCGHAADALTEARLYELARQKGEPEPQRHLEAMHRHFASAASVDFVGPISDDAVDVAAVVRSVASAEERAKRSTTVRGGNDATVKGEGKVVRRLVQELVDNAHRHGEGPVRLVLEATDDGVVLTVTDHGPGVPEAERERLFHPYARLNRPTDGEGLGLGLTIARRLAEALQGTIAFTNMPAGGTAVSVRLPRAGD